MRQLGVQPACPRAFRCEETFMGDLLQPWHLLIIAVIVVLLFGGKKLPELGKGLGEVKNASNDAHTITPKPEETATKS
jgi:sec-independent protein translocase protein TatA